MQFSLLRRVSCFGIASVAIGFLSLACGPGSAAKGVRPDMPKGGDALGSGKKGECVDEPWVVDLSSSDTDKLTSAMSNGVVIVGHTCNGLQILQNCSAKTSHGKTDYSYEGKPSLVETKQLKDADEIKAELSGGVALAAKMSSDIQRGVSIDIAYTHVGSAGTTARVGKDDLDEKRPGGCKGATHIVEAVMMGAYQMKGSTSAELSAAVEAFKQGVEAKSASSAVSTKTGGKASDCASAKEGDTAPVNGCRFPLQLRLAELEAGSVHGGPGGNGAPPPPPAPRVQGVTAKTCKLGDGAACTSSCEKLGDGASCAILGFMFEKGKGVSNDPKRAVAAYKMGCDKRNLEACAGLGTAYSKGDGVEKDDSKAETILRDACSRLNARACSSLGNRARKAGRAPEAVSMLTRACNLGYGRACFYAGSLMLENRDADGAFRNSQRGCDAADLRGCLLAGSLMSNGHGTSANAQVGNSTKTYALKGLESQCANKDNEACEVLGDWNMGWYENPAKEPKKAADWYQKACDHGEERACTEAQNAKSGKAPGSPSGLGGPVANTGGGGKPTSSSNPVVPGGKAPQGNKPLPFGKKK